MINTYLEDQVNIIYEFITHSKLSEYKKKELLITKLKEIQLQAKNELIDYLGSNK